MIVLAEHNKAIDAVAEAISLMANLGGGGSFFQLKDKLSAVSAKLNAMSTLAEKYEIFGPVVKSLAQIAVNAPSNVISNIIDLLRKLKAEVEYTKTIDEELELNRKTLWEAELNDLTNQRNHLTERKKTLETNLVNYAYIITDNEEKTTNHNAEFARYVIQHDELVISCDKEQTDYDTATAGRYNFP